MANITNVAMLLLVQTNLEEAIAFYEKLGLKRVFYIKERWAEMDLDGVKLGLCPSDKPIGEIRTGFVFGVENLKEFYNTNKDNIPFLDQPVEAAHGVMASIKDPGGNIIDLYEQTPQKLHDALKQGANDGDDCCKPQATSCCKD